jgi:hypothetical protein
MAQSTGTLSGKLNSPRRQRQLFILSGAVLVIGVVAFLVTILHGTGNKYPDKFSNQPAQVTKPEIKMKPTAAEFGVARKFIETAVMRKNLDASYNIVHVDLKGRLTRKQWDTGNIPVIDYPAANAKSAAFTTDYSYKDSALFEIDLIAKPHSGSGVRPELLFFIGLKRSEKNGKYGPWLVNYWEPHWSPPIPAAVN